MRRFLLGLALMRDPEPAEAGGGGSDPTHTDDPATCPCSSCSAARMAKAKAEKAAAAKASAEKAASMADVHETRAELQRQIDEIRPPKPAAAAPAPKRTSAALVVALVVGIPLALCAGLALLLRRKPELAKVIRFPGARRAAT